MFPPRQSLRADAPNDRVSARRPPEMHRRRRCVPEGRCVFSIIVIIIIIIVVLALLGFFARGRR